MFQTTNQTLIRLLTHSGSPKRPQVRRLWNLMESRAQLGQGKIRTTSNHLVRAPYGNNTRPTTNSPQSQWLKPLCHPIKASCRSFRSFLDKNPPSCEPTSQYRPEKLDHKLYYVHYRTMFVNEPWDPTKKHHQETLWKHSLTPGRGLFFWTPNFDQYITDISTFK